MNTEESLRARLDDAQKYLAPFFGIEPLLGCDTNPDIVDLPSDLQDYPGEPPCLVLAVDFFYDGELLGNEILDSYDAEDCYLGVMVGSQLYQLVNPFTRSAAREAVREHMDNERKGIKCDWQEAEAYGNLYSLVTSCCGFAYAEHKGTLRPAERPKEIFPQDPLELIAAVLNSAQEAHHVFRKFYDATGPRCISQLAHVRFEEARRLVIDTIGFDLWA